VRQERTTGLNSYILRTPLGQFVYSERHLDSGFDREASAVYLWTPEELEVRVAEVAKRIPWAGAVFPWRHRP
jgi:hypothetical protein